MDVRYSPDEKGFKKLDTHEMRDTFLIKLFEKDNITLVYSDIDRSITGSALPVDKELELQASKKEMAAEYFTERREIGVVNIGGKGTLTINDDIYEMDYKNAMYIGRGNKKIVFKSEDKNNPAKFYFVSYPAHTEYPDKLIGKDDAVVAKLGSLKTSNERTIYKYIHPDVVKSCQIGMGWTELEEGSVWNTMPAHTHPRRSEVYMYFNLTEDDFVVHLNGSAGETRHIIMRNEEAVLSTSWSLHSGCGTKNYSFIWAMGGENQDYDDMDWIAMKDMF